MNPSETGEVASSTEGLTRKAARATWWSALEIASRHGAQVLIMVVVARLLTPSDLGLMAILLVFTSIGAVLVESGLGTALIQRQRCTDDDETTVFAFATATSLVLALALLIAAPFVASFFGEPRLTALLRAASIMFPLAALGTVPDALLTMRLDFKARTKAQVVASLTSGALAVLLAWIGWGVWSLLVQLVAASATRTSLLWASSRWRPRGSFQMASLKSLGAFGGYLLLASLMNTSFIRLQSLLLGKLFDTRSLGLFTMADVTRQAPANFVSAVLNRVGLPTFSAIANDRARLREALRASLRVSMFFFVPLMFGLAVVAEPFVLLVYGEQWRSVAPMLSIMAIGTALWPVHVLHLAAINAQGRSDLFFRLEIVKQSFWLLVVVIASRWAGIGLAWAFLVASMFSAVVNAHYAKKLLEYRAIDQLADVGVCIAFAGGGAAVAAWLLMWSGSSIGGAAASLVLGIVVYAMLAGIGATRTLVDIVGVWRRSGLARRGIRPKPNRA